MVKVRPGYRQVNVGFNHRGNLVKRENSCPVFYFSSVGDPQKWEGFSGGIECGTPPVARFVARWANRLWGRMGW